MVYGVERVVSQRAIIEGPMWRARPIGLWATEAAAPCGQTYVLRRRAAAALWPMGPEKLHKPWPPRPD